MCERPEREVLQNVVKEVVTRGCACFLLLLQPSPPWAADQSGAVAGLPRGREPESCSSLHHDCKLCHTCDKCYSVTCNVYIVELVVLQSYSRVRGMEIATANTHQT